MKFLFVFLLFISSNSFGQNTVSLPENGTSPKADLSKIASMEGHWKGKAFGGITEEIWSPPLAGSMMYFDGFTFEKISDNEINIYGLIGHEDGSSEEVKFNYIRYKNQ